MTPARSERGSSIIEVVITTGLVLLVMAGLLAGMHSVQKAEAYSRGRAEALDTMRTAMSRMTKEIRQGSTVVGTPTTDRLELETYVKGVPEAVTYSVEDGNLTRREGAEEEVVLQELVNSELFSYLPSADSPEVVKITFVVEPQNLPATTVTVESEVRLRNLEGEE